MNNDNAELLALFNAGCNGTLTPEQTTSLNEQLDCDADARQLYLDYVDVHVSLVNRARRDELDEPSLLLDRELAEPSEVTRLQRNFARPSWRITACVAASLVAMIIVIAQYAQKPVSRPQTPAMAQDTAPAVAVQLVGNPSLFVGRITTLTRDVQWGNSDSAHEFLLRIRMGQRIDIQSGMIELEYYSGAKIILHSPCVFVPTGIESGRLERGQVTGKVNNGNFILTTPSAKVVDLGTEFGAAVGPNLQTDVFVFDGEVEVVAGQVDANKVEKRLLKKGMGVTVQTSGTIIPKMNAEVRKLPRSIPTSSATLDTEGELSLVDVLNGRLSAPYRIAGVVAADTGQADQNPWLRSDGPGYSLCNGFRATQWHPFVDGVFIPSDSGNNNQLDSTGNLFNLPASTGRTWGPVWSRRGISGKSETTSVQDYWGTGTLEPVVERLSLCKTGMIGLHSNVGITFDLHAIRKQCGKPITEFRGIVANIEEVEKQLPKWASTVRLSADMRVFVDGSLRVSRLDFCSDDGDLLLSTKIIPTDQFLTFVCSDSSNEWQSTDAYDHVVLIDPVLIHPR